MAGQQGGGSRTARTVILIVATITTGLTAGVFTDWSNTVMPGLSTVDDRTFVQATRALDTAITNPLFLGVEFLGALLFTALSAVLRLRAGPRPVLIWIVAALACYLVAVVVTFVVHEPLNETLRAGGADLAAVRAQFDEARWTAWNAVRAVASTVAFACLTWALVLHGRHDRTAGRRVSATPAES